MVFVAGAVEGYKTLGDLIAAGKAKPGSLNYSSAGVGSASHFAGERLRVSAGFEAQHDHLQRRGRGGDRSRRRAHRFHLADCRHRAPLINEGKLAALAVQRTSASPRCRRCRPPSRPD